MRPRMLESVNALRNDGRKGEGWGVHTDIKGGINGINHVYPLRHKPRGNYKNDGC